MNPAETYFHVLVLSHHVGLVGATHRASAFPVADVAPRWPQSRQAVWRATFGAFIGYLSAKIFRLLLVA
jgi:hypothetical protein